MKKYGETKQEDVISDERRLNAIRVWSAQKKTKLGRDIANEMVVNLRKSAARKKIKINKKPIL